MNAMNEKTKNSTPDLSVIIVTSGREERIRRTIAGLRGQSIRERLEIVIVVPENGSRGLQGIEADGFLRVVVIEESAGIARSEARMRGVMNAAAPLTAFIEDHAYPDEGWAEAVLNAHTRSRAAVGYRILNGNPDKGLSWANLFLHYGPWVERIAPIGDDILPSENISYQRDILLQYGESLRPFFENDYTLHRDLRRKGYELYFEPAARLFHSNVDTLSATAAYNFSSGRIFATARSYNWSIWQRFVYAGGFFLIPFIRAPRVYRDIRRTGRIGVVPKIILPLMIGLASGAFGEMVGYLARNGEREPLV